MLCLTAAAQAQLSQPGDIAFVGFNADGDDDIAFVTLKDIDPSTNIYFCDSEWNGTGFPADDEGDFTWTSPAEVVPAGSIITINNLSASIETNIGSITHNNAGGLSSGSEAMFAFLGTAPRTVTTMLAAIANSASAYGTLENTGLLVGTTAVTLPEGTDLGVYNGPRTGLDHSGFLAQIGADANWLLEDTSADDHNNGTTPDLPFSLDAFTIADGDATAPTVANVAVTDAQTLTLVFSESVNQAQAETLANYAFSPALDITSAVYNSELNTVVLTHAPQLNGVAYTISVADIADANENVMADFTSAAFFHNPLASGLIITEIMYNAPSDDSDALEFLELYNNSGAVIALGGIQVKDEGNFTFSFPQMDLAAGETVLLATDKASADAFYGVSFLDMPQGISNALGNGGELLQIVNTANTVISSVEYDDAAPWPTSPDGNGPSLELMNPSGNLNDGANWAPATNLVGQSQGADVFASPGSFIPNTTASIGFVSEYVFVSESAGQASVQVALSNASDQVVTATVSVVSGAGSAEAGTDFTFTSQTIEFPANAADPVSVNIPLTDDAQARNDRFLVLELSDVTGASLGTMGTQTIYITDDEQSAPSASEALDITHLSSYLVDASGSAEIVAHDPVSQRLFVVNSTATKLAILDFSNPEAISQIAMIDMTAYGIGATSVAFSNGLVAATVEGPNFQNGKVVFMDIDGANVQTVEAGVLPDMAVFTPDGSKLLTANEGQPNSDYSVDPEGTISVIDVSGGLGNITQANVSHINFNAFDSQMAELKAQGIRIFGPGASVSQDLEPEYITVSADGTQAWVSLQENNAVGVIDLTNNTITDLLPLGTKDHSLPQNAFDSSDQNGEIFMANWPVKGVYMPDAMANFTIGGQAYLITANEGDAREYDNMEEEMKVGDAEYVLDPSVFPNADILKKNFNLGRLAVTSVSGDTDGDGDYDEIHAFGGRSFSIWNASTGEQVFDSGSDFERITAADPEFGALFNASNDNGNFKNRSDNKGPEPEGVTVAEINGATYAFIALERIGGIMVYDVTNPAAPVFVAYKNTRTANGGDLGAEGIIYIAAADSPTNTGLVVVANEVSATISVFSVNNDLSVTEHTAAATAFAYPNPVRNGQLFFAQPVNAELFDLSGRKVMTKNNAAWLDMHGLQKGVYLVRANGKVTQKIVLE